MSREIDERVVEMRFDNREFEQNVNNTISTIDNLKHSLNFNGLGESISNVGDSFGALARRTIEITAITRVTNGLINSVKRLSDSFSTLANAKSGFDVYDVKIRATQTIMSGTGKTIEEVGEVLNELNTYADKTIYSLSDMTDNLSKFTNAGVDIDKAKDAIMGISNAAALAGASSSEASRAMYNFSQALSIGKVLAIDWKSIENANMATKDFKQSLIDAAVEAGTLTKEADGTFKTIGGEAVSAVGNFRDTLKDGWLTSEVLLDSLHSFTDEETELGQKAIKAATEVKTFNQLISVLKESLQSGWGRTWEIIIGNLEEAKALFTSINDVIGGFFGRMTNARNELLQNWKDLGGRQMLLEGLKNVFNGILSVIKPIRDAFREVFKALTPGRLMEITVKFRDFSRKLTLSDEAAAKLKKTFTVFFGTLKSVGSFVGKIFSKTLKPLLRFLKSAAGAILDINNFLSDIVLRIVENVKELGVVDKVTNKIKDTFVSIKSLFERFSSKLKTYAKQYKDAAVKIGTNLVSGLVNGVTRVVSRIVSVAKLMADMLINTLKSFLGIHSPSKKCEAIGGFCVEGLIMGIEALHSKIRKTGKQMGKKLIDGINEQLSKLSSKINLSSLFVSSKDFVTGLFKEGGFFANMFERIKGFWTKVKPVIDGIKEIFTALKAQLAPVIDYVKERLKGFKDEIISLIQKIDTNKILASLNQLSFTGLLVGLTTLSVRLSTFLSQFKFGKLSKSIASFLEDVGISIKKFAKGYANEANSAAVLNLAKALLFFAGALVIVSLVPEDRIWQLVKVLSVVMAELTAFVVGLGAIGGKLAKKGSAFSSFTNALSSVMLVSLGAAVLLIVGAMKIIGDMDPEKVEYGLSKITMIVVELFALGAVAAAGKSALKGYTSMATAILLMIAAIAILNKMDVNTIWDGIIKLGIIAGFIAVVMALMSVIAMIPAKSSVVSSAGSVLVLIAAVLLMVVAIKQLSAEGMDDSFKVGLHRLGVSLILLVGVFAAIEAIQKFLGGKANLSVIISIVGIVLAIGTLISALIMIGYMPNDAYIKGMAGITIALVGIEAILISLKAVSKLASPALVGSVLAIALIIAELAGLVALFGSDALGSVNVGKGIAVMVASMVMLAALLSSLGTVASVSAGPLLALAAVLAAFGAAVWLVADGLKLMSEAFKNVVYSVIALVNGASLENIAASLGTLIAFLGPASVALAAFSIAFTLATASVVAGIGLMALSSISLILVGLNVSALSVALTSLAGSMTVVGNAFTNLALKLLLGATIFKTFADVVKGIFGIESPSKLFYGFGDFIIQGFVNGLKDSWKKISGGATKIFTGFTDLIRKIFGIHSPSKVFAEMGRYVDEGFVIGVKEYSDKVSKSAADMANGAVSSVKDKLSGVKSIFDDSASLDPTIRPILDLSDIKSGVGKIDDMLSSERAMDIAYNSDLSRQNGNAPIINMTINGAEGQDVNQLAEIISQKLNNSIRRRMSVWQ